MAEDLEVGAGTVEEGTSSSEAAIAQEFGGEAVAPVASSELGETEDTPSLTLGELGETALDTSTESSADTDPEPIPETALEHDLAEDVAYAEKPFQEGIEKAEEAGKLSPETKGTLEWLSSQAAEKAMTDYAESRSKMTEAEEVLREHASEFMQLSHSGVEGFVKYGRCFVSAEETKKAVAEDATGLLETVVGDQLEQILADDSLTAEQRLKRISSLEGIKYGTVAVLENIHKVNAQAEIERMYEGQDIEERLLPVLWGHAIATISTGYPFAALISLERIAELSGKEVGEIIDPLLPQISKGVLTHNIEFKSSNDSSLEKYGYLWSKSRRQYVKAAS